MIDDYMTPTSRPELVFLDPAKEWRAVVTSDVFDMAQLDWRQAAELRLLAERLLWRLDQLARP